MASFQFPIATSALVIAVLLLSGRDAVAGELISRTPVVHVQVEAGTSQAKVIEELRAQGYSEIKMSALAANPQNPHPERMTDAIDHPEKTPARQGWNGVAVKDGQLVQVYVYY
jgi:hypothetical protein